MVCIVEYMDLESQQQAMEILHSNSPYRVLLAEEAIQQEVIAPFFKKAKLKTEQGEEDEEDAAEGEKMSAQALLRPQVCTRVLLLSNIVEIDDVSAAREKTMAEALSFGLLVKGQCWRRLAFGRSLSVRVGALAFWMWPSGCVYTLHVGDLGRCCCCYRLP